jgi:hypothetical protein
MTSIQLGLDLSLTEPAVGLRSLTTADCVLLDRGRSVPPLGMRGELVRIGETVPCTSYFITELRY